MLSNLKNVLKFSLILLLSTVSVKAFGQSQKQAPALTISGYVDAYYAYFTDSLPPNALQAYTTVSPRNERIGLNMAQLSLIYNSEKLRSTLTLHAGDIAEATWSDEFSLVQEANVGVLLVKSLWLDAGFFHTHIGTESFLPKNDFLSSTAVATYNEPFYQSGARLSYEPGGKFNAELWALNGYNRFLDNNDAKSVGLLASYAFRENLSLTYTSLFGRESDQGAAIKQFRTYQNLYLNTSWKGRIYLTAGADFGSQTNSVLLNNGKTAYMYNWLITSRYQFTRQFSATVRAERFSDREGFISGVLADPTGELQGLQLWGFTAGVEYKPAEGAYLRLEGRQLRAENIVFYTDGSYTDQRTEVHLTFGVFFDKIFNWNNVSAPGTEAIQGL